MLIVIAGLGLIGIGTLVVLQVATAHTSLARARMKTYVSRPARYTDERAQRLSESSRKRIFEPIARMLASLATRMTPTSNRGQLRERIRKAGLTITERSFLTVKGGLAVAPLLLAAVLAARGSAPTSVFAATLLGVVGMMAPDSWLTMRQRARRQQIDRDLPDVLDLLTVSVESGLGFDESALKVTERLQGPLSDEIASMLRALRLGESRRDALAGLVGHCGSDEVAAFSRAIIQGDELGVSLGTTLRTQAADMRERRGIAAEEQATKAPVKMLFPTALFIFPALFVVTLGPAFLNLMELFRG
jgi:tight adherence protein C